MRTQVGIVGAGPGRADAGAAAASAGIESIIIENRSRDYIENRIRAGLIEHWAADLLIDVGVGERMQREGMLHWGINIGINGELHRIDFKELVDKRVTIYGQQEVVKDLVARRLADGGPLLFEVDGVSVHDLTIAAPEDPLHARGQARRKSNAISSPAATAFTASAGRAFPTACSAYSSATIRSAGSASCRNRRRRTTS